MRISILIPVFNGASTIKETLDSIFEQEFVTLHRDLEVVICNNNSTDNTIDVIRKFKDKRIKLCNYNEYVPFNKSLERCVLNATGDVIVFISSNDVFLNSAIYEIYMAFKQDDIAMLVRPYYFFYKDPLKPIRYTRHHDTTVKFLLETLTQLSGIAIRKKFITTDFSPLRFVEFPWMAFPITIGNKVAVLDKPNVAIRSDVSGAQELVAFKDSSPAQNWEDMIRHTIKDKVPADNLIKEFVRKNYCGLVPIRAYAGLKYVVRELKHLDWCDYRFFLYVGILFVTPSWLLRFVIKKWKEIKEKNARVYLC
jgi:glycosyltransferase involved in cell wall biosynthesis